MGILTELIQRNAWGAVHDLLAEPHPHPPAIEELFIVDRLGRTPLHYACVKRGAPDNVVEWMLYHAQKRGKARLRDICGNTPLHAAAYNGNESVVRVLSNELRMPLPMHVNDVGSTPLLMAWKKYLDPTFTLFGNVAICRSPPKPSHLSLLYGIASVKQLQEDPHCAPLQDVWNKTICLIGRTSGTRIGKAPQHSSPIAHHPAQNAHLPPPPSLTRPLHELATVGGKRHIKVPTIAFWLAIQMFPYQLLEKDAHGNLPIHLAAMHEELPSIPLMLENSSNSKMRQASASALTQLAQHCPKSASTVNASGKLPIHLAIECGKSYANGINALVCAAPFTLEVPAPPPIRLAPFLLAAASSKASLTVVWELIRARPDLITIMTTATVNARKNKRSPTAQVGPEAKRSKLAQSV